MNPRLSMIAAIGKNRALGYKNQLLWTIPDDLKRFKEITTKHPIIMGRKTYESIYGMLGKPLPNRTSVVLMRKEEFDAEDPLFQFENVIIAHSPEEAVAKASELDKEEIFIGGGAQIYKLFLPLAHRLYLTLIDDEKEADAFFPEYETEFTKKISDESHELNGLKYSWVTLEK
ncbi:dihydrofolate reductase [Candidatus Parcubacteria bacterium]|nr:dihydrofolate reductase [Candidatus Parcubacteria bacterium]